MNPTKDLISTLDQRVRDVATLFEGGILNRMRRIVFHPIVITVRFLQMRILKGQFFMVHTHTFFGYPMTTFSFNYVLWLTGCLTGAEVRLQKYLLKHLPKDSVFFDIGAHHGFYSLLAHYSLQGGKITIHAFEPSRMHYEVLKRNVRNLEGVECNMVAVCATEGTRTFYEEIGAGSSIMKGLYKNVPKVDENSFHSTEVQCETLDAYCARTGVAPTFLKIDVEGAEYEVLVGAKATLREMTPTIVMEAWQPPYDNTNHIKAVQFLEEHGYTAYVLTNEGDANYIAYQDLYALLTTPGKFDNYLFRVVADRVR